MMDREQFTSAVLAAEPTLYRVAKTMLRSEHDCADAAQHAVFQNVAGPYTYQRVQHDIAPSAAACAV